MSRQGLASGRPLLVSRHSFPSSCSKRRSRHTHLCEGCPPHGLSRRLLLLLSRVTHSPPCAINREARLHCWLPPDPWQANSPTGEPSLPPRVSRHICPWRRDARRSPPAAGTLQLQAEIRRRVTHQDEPEPDYSSNTRLTSGHLRNSMRTRDKFVITGEVEACGVTLGI